MSELTHRLIVINKSKDDKASKVDAMLRELRAYGLKDVDVNIQKPWGAYIRLDGSGIERFIGEFFPGLSLDEARFGKDTIDLSPKILFVSPGQRLSLQKHARRAERWRFLTDGAYYKSKNDTPGDIRHAKAGEVVQFEKGDVHRLCGMSESSVLVAEIWQHTDERNPSNEEDIVRLADDYNR